MTTTLKTTWIDRRLETIAEALADPSVLLDTVGTLEEMAPDPVNKERLLAWLREGIGARDGRFELRTALRALARAIEPRSYLEIGTRRGWSLAQVACEAPRARAWCFDRWIEGYADAQNPGPEFVRSEIEGVAPRFAGGLRFFSGNSHDLLPLFFQSVPIGPAEIEDLSVLRAGEDASRAFDLITVDGDHTALGAWWDLTDVLPFLALGGAIVFDDLVDFADDPGGTEPESRYAALRPPVEGLPRTLAGVWERLKSDLVGFEFFEWRTGIAPVGVAVRVA